VCYCSTTVTGRNPFAAKINNDNNNNNKQKGACRVVAMSGAIEVDRGTAERVIMMSVGVFISLKAVGECVITLLRFKVRL
jgi:hypothetical protein